MCFSASASFVSASVIASLGIYSYKNSTRKEERPLATIPLLFATQQVLEGFIWLTLNETNHVSTARTLFASLFLFFAWVIWPLLVPWAVYRIDPNPFRKRVALVVLYAGGLLAIVSLFQILFAHPQVHVQQARLVYQLHHELKSKWLVGLLQMLYIVVTLLPLLLCSIRGVVVLGATNAMALLVSYLFFNDSLPSVWCFFAAILSVLIAKIIPVRANPKLQKLHEV